MITKNAQETIEYGELFAQKLKGGEIIALTGNLGSGKTTFVQGLAKGLKIKDNITSPTFVILKEYTFRHAILRPKSNLRGRILWSKIKKLIHIDAYRIDNINDIKSVGIEDYLYRQDVIMVIEWADKIKEILPKNIININFKAVVNGSNELRKISINSSSSLK